MRNKWLKREIRKMIKEVNTHKFLVMVYGYVRAMYNMERGVDDE